MDVEGFVKDVDDTLFTVVADIEIGLNREGDTAWIKQTRPDCDELIVVHVSDAPYLIKKLQAWVDAQ